MRNVRAALRKSRTAREVNAYSLRQIAEGEAHVAGWRSLAVGSAVAMALVELVSATTIDAPAVALFFAALFLVGAWWTRRPAMGGPVLLAVLSIVELVFIPTFERNNAYDWTIQLAVVAASTACLVGCIATIRQNRRENSPAR